MPKVVTPRLSHSSMETAAPSAPTAEVGSDNSAADSDTGGSLPAQQSGGKSAACRLSKSADTIRAAYAGSSFSRSASLRVQGTSDRQAFDRMHAARPSAVWEKRVCSDRPASSVVEEGKPQSASQPSAHRSNSEPPVKKSSPGQQVPLLAMAKAAASGSGPLSGRGPVASANQRPASQRSAVSRSSGATTSRASAATYSTEMGLGHSAWISTTPRKLSEVTSVRSPGPAVYNRTRSQDSWAVRGQSFSGTKFSKAPRRTECSLLLLGQASPGVAKYNQGPRPPTPGGSCRIGGAPRWRSDRGYNGLPQRPPEISPGPMQYTPRHHYSSRFK